jgi:hypothetical protein
VTPVAARRLLLASAVLGLVLCVVGALVERTDLTTPMAVGLVMGATAIDVRARGEDRRRRRREP